jgi:hypothetical protein
MKILLSVGFVDVLGAVFITLKLTKVIDWSWWWVLAPLWGQLVLLDIYFVFWGIICYIAFNKRKANDREITNSINDMTNRLRKTTSELKKAIEKDN